MHLEAAAIRVRFLPLHTLMCIRELKEENFNFALKFKFPESTKESLLKT